MRSIMVLTLAAALAACAGTQQESMTTVDTGNSGMTATQYAVAEMGPSVCSVEDISDVLTQALRTEEDVREFQRGCGINPSTGVLDDATGSCIHSTASTILQARRELGMCSETPEPHGSAEDLVRDLRESLAQVPPPLGPMPSVSPLPAELRFAAWSGFAIVSLDHAPPRAAALDANGPITQDAFSRGVELQAEQIPGGGWCFPVPGSMTFRAICSSDNGVWGEVAVRDSEFAGHTLNVRATKYPMSGLIACSGDICGNVYSLATDDVVGCSGPRCRELFDRNLRPKSE
ncbi:MAG: hypothetical protein Q7T01_02960 [bacterium]|nr:hypothetical protein [bacterium]